MGGLIQSFGEDFLTEKDRQKFKKIHSADVKKGRQFLWEQACPTLEPLWYYTVSLCRILLQDENRLTAADAYWMGIIDEVIGTDLVGFRVVSEEPQNPKPPTSSPNAPLPPPAQSAPSAAPIRTQP